MAKFHANRVAITGIDRHLALMMLGDAVARELKRVQSFLGTCSSRRLDLRRRHCNADLLQIDGVELAREID